ncbi:MAG: FAD-linked oxidase C-terminal domain-containing protein [bacterium]|nr:FAD-linked oxidase C-terminal domain-containing protein [bacterium]
MVHYARAARFPMKEKDLVRLCRGIVGKEHATDALEDRICHGCDATREQALPDLVVRPGCAEEVGAILSLANERRVPVYPRGAGSGLTGGALPLRGGILLDTSRLNRIISIDPADSTAVVEAGVVLGEFQAAVERRGLFYPPDPASSDFCTIGGNLAECAGGLHCVKYGVTRDYVLSAEAVLPCGDIIHTGSGTLKSVVGYDIGRLLIGSEGTLCVFTRATLRLIPLPECVRTMLASFRTVADGVRAAVRIASGPVLPRTLEIMDELTIRCIRAYKPFGLPAGAAAVLLAESDGPPAAAAAGIARMAEACRAEGAIEVETPSDKAEADLLWEVRRAASPALYSLSPRKINEDVCVPRSRLPSLFEGVAGIAARGGIAVACFGHAGDGNIHVNALYDAADPDERSRAERGIEEVFRLVLDLGGSISGEHGIGTAKARFLSWEVGGREIALMRAIKRLLDPNDILNPGKIFPDEPRISADERGSSRILP